MASNQPRPNPKIAPPISPPLPMQPCPATPMRCGRWKVCLPLCLGRSGQPCFLPRLYQWALVPLTVPPHAVHRHLAPIFPGDSLTNSCRWHAASFAPLAFTSAHIPNIVALFSPVAALILSIWSAMPPTPCHLVAVGWQHHGSDAQRRHHEPDGDAGQRFQ